MCVFERRRLSGSRDLAHAERLGGGPGVNWGFVRAAAVGRRCARAVRIAGPRRSIMAGVVFRRASAQRGPRRRRALEPAMYALGWSPPDGGATHATWGLIPGLSRPARGRARAPCMRRSAGPARSFHAGVGSGSCQSAPLDDSVHAGPSRDDQSSWVLRANRARHIFTGASGAEGGAYDECMAEIARVGVSTR